MSKSTNQRNPIYKLGDKVYLNVGGPQMSINEVIQKNITKEFSGSYRCQWFAGKKLESGVFPEESITKTNPKP